MSLFLLVAWIDWPPLTRAVIRYHKWRERRAFHKGKHDDDER